MKLSLIGFLGLIALVSSKFVPKETQVSLLADNEDGKLTVVCTS